MFVLNIIKKRVLKFLKMAGFTPKIFLKKVMDITTLLIEKKISIKIVEDKL